ncbi:MAG: EamA family transporter [Acidobacteriaceae bacterium]
MTATAATSVLGISAALIWGAADFAGGLGARYLRVYWLLAISHGASLVALLLIASLLHQPRPDERILAFGLISGFAGGTALLVCDYALSLGSMGTTAAVTGLLTAALPVAFSLTTIGAPSARQLGGFVLAAGAIWLISSPSGPGKSPVEAQGKKLVLAVVAGVGFGVFLIALRLANSGGILWPLAASRVGSLTLAIAGGFLFSRDHFMQPQASLAPISRSVAQELNTSRQKDISRPWKIGIALALLSSLCDTGGNFFFVAATRIGRLDVAAVLSSLYPASTILLAMWLLKERTSRRQAIGMAAALVAVALIS